MGRDVAVALLVVGLVGLLIILGNSSSDDSGRSAVTTTTLAPARTTPARNSRRHATPAVPRIARLRLIPTGAVWVCLQAAGKRTLIGGQVVDASSNLPTYRSRRFKMTFGNGNLRMRVNGRTLDVPEVRNAVGYVVDRSGKRAPLSAADRPTCS